MADFLTTRGTADRLEQIIQNAERRLSLISPYLQVSPQNLTRLKSADARGVEIHLVYRTDKLTAEERAKLAGFKRLRLYTLDNLHAKCYANEKHVLISSMNLYGYSEANNWEMGILLTNEDTGAIAAARKEINEIFQAANPQPAPGSIRSMLAGVFQRPQAPPKQQRTASATQFGYCIRCSNEIRYRPQSPLCASCYTSWAAWENENYPERNCHRCAEPADVSKAKPLCGPCFREAPFTAPSRTF